jgi:hypothetical protein
MDLNKLKIEATERLGFKRDDYFSVAKQFNPEVLSWYIDMAFAIGFNEGIGYKRIVNEKPVYFINDYGTKSPIFPSIKEAAKVVGRNEVNLGNAIREGRKCAGYNWKYAEQEV